jgi:hypothetical protein
MSYVSVDIDIDEFLSSCGSYDIDYIIKSLIEDGHLPDTTIRPKGRYQITPGEELHIENCQKLSNKYFQMTNEETALIEQLVKKYG